MSTKKQKRDEVVEQAVKKVKVETKTQKKKKEETSSSDSSESEEKQKVAIIFFWMKSSNLIYIFHFLHFYLQDWICSNETCLV